MDAAAFYDLPEAGRRLRADPVRLARQAAARAIPAGRREGAWVLPKDWVDAEAGLAPADADALKASWIERLAPPSLAARRSRCYRSRLPAARLLDAAAAGRALFCDRAHLARLDADGTLPALRVDGEPRFDAELVEALAAEADGDAAAPRRAAARRTLVAAWAVFEYADGAAPAGRGGEAPPPPRPPLARAEGFETRDDDDEGGPPSPVRGA